MNEKQKTMDEFTPKMRLWVRVVKKAQVRQYEPQEFGAGIEQQFEEPLKPEDIKSWEKRSMEAVNKLIDDRIEIERNNAKNSKEPPQ